MSVRMRWEQCCDADGCTKPALHGALCAPCFLAATPARRAVELLAAAAVQPDDGRVDAAGAVWLRRLWAA